MSPRLRDLPPPRLASHEQGDTETIGVTGFHKFYSQTRRNWISTVELRPFEIIRGLSGPLTVIQRKLRENVHRVYNITVEDEHVYHVSAYATLVHNDDCHGGKLPEDKVIDAAVDWLGEGYREIAPDVFRSVDDQRQFRWTNLDQPTPYVNFEFIGDDGRTIVENAHVYLEVLTNP